MKYQHGGQVHFYARQLGISPKKILDFSANINPLGPPTWLKALVAKELVHLVHYPDDTYTGLKQALSVGTGEPPESIVPGNGAADLLFLCARTLAGRRALIPAPAYGDYVSAAQGAGLPVKLVLPRQSNLQIGPQDVGHQIQPGDMVFIGSPNNPTGAVWDRRALNDLAVAHPQAYFIVDESFKDFVPGFQSFVGQRPPNVIVIYSFTKIYAVPGLRIGLCFAHPDIAAQLNRGQSAWPLNSLAAAVAQRAVADTSFITKTQLYVQKERTQLVKRLSGLSGFQVLPGAANFLLVHSPQISAAQLSGALLAHRILIRNCANFAGLDEHYFRIGVQTAAKNKKLIRALTTNALSMA